MNLNIEEAEERRKLVGFCEPCNEWYELIDEPSNLASRLHSCGGKPSNKQGFQLTTQRTFNPAAKKLSKAKMKKLGRIGA